MPRWLFAVLGPSRALRQRLPEYDALLAQVGEHTRSKACLYINKLAHVHKVVLAEIAQRTDAAPANINHCTLCGA